MKKLVVIVVVILLIIFGIAMIQSESSDEDSATFFFSFPTATSGPSPTLVQIEPRRTPGRPPDEAGPPIVLTPTSVAE